MKFTTNTKPFADALDLGIINSNVSNFHKKSCLVQISADAHTLKINVEASRICTEIRLKGSGEGEPATIFVDSLLLKQLARTLESNTITLEFADGGLIIQSNKSKFTLPKMLDDAEFELNAPVLPEYAATDAIDLNKSDWKFVKDNQMYAISMAFIHPVYTRVWVGESGDVLVGDYDTSLFTHSMHSKLGNTCLLTDTIINLFNSLPEGAKLIKSGRDYLIQLSGDSYEYLTQFTPLYESDPDVGSYNSDVFLDMMQHPSTSNTVNTASITKLLNQATLLSSTSEDTIKLKVYNNTITLQDRNVDGQIVSNGDASLNYEVEFKLELIKQVISNYADEIINISPLMQEDAVIGIIVWNDQLTTIVAGVE